MPVVPLGAIDRRNRHTTHPRGHKCMAAVAHSQGNRCCRSARPGGAHVLQQERNSCTRGADLQRKLAKYVMADDMRVGDVMPGHWSRGKGKVGQTHVDLLERRSPEV